MFFEANLVAICGTTLFIIWRQRKASALAERDVVGHEAKELLRRETQFSRIYLIAYGLLMGADWLQGAYIYALYKYTLELDEGTVATLFVSGFVAGAASSPFVGTIADKYGRKKTCLYFCLLYSASCLLSAWPGAGLPVLFVGRALGGVCTTILYSTPESWMVSQWNAQSLSAPGLERLFGHCTTLNSLVAIASGLISEVLVGVTGSRRTPFFASVAALGFGYWQISSTWLENYGSELKKRAKPSKAAIQVFFSDKKIMALSAIQALFEGSMYLFVFYWTPTLVFASSASSLSPSPSLPFGVIFSCFMGSMALGSLAFQHFSSSFRLPTLDVLQLGLAASGLALLACPLFPFSTPTVFYAFNVKEFCVGLYFPCMGSLRSRLIPEENRAGLYSLSRMPLNAVVVAALVGAGEGVGYRNGVWWALAGSLIVIGQWTVGFLDD